MAGLIGIAHFTFHEGLAEEFKRLSQRCMDIVRAEDTGTLRYEVFLDEGETGAVVIEEYVDADALRQHSMHLGEELSAAILATGTVHGELLGDLDDAFRAQLAGGPVQAFSPFLSLG